MATAVLGMSPLPAIGTTTGDAAATGPWTGSAMRVSATRTGFIGTNRAPLNPLTKYPVTSKIRCAVDEAPPTQTKESVPVPLRATVTPSALVSPGLALTIEQFMFVGSDGMYGPAKAQPNAVGPVTVRLPVTATAPTGTPPAPQIDIVFETLLE